VHHSCVPPRKAAAKTAMIFCPCGGDMVLLPGSPAALLRGAEPPMPIDNHSAASGSLRPSQAATKRGHPPHIRKSSAASTAQASPAMRTAGGIC
jgi:hypothetical protein